jgi:hypothetical protein
VKIFWLIELLTTGYPNRCEHLSSSSGSSQDLGGRGCCEAPMPSRLRWLRLCNALMGAAIITWLRPEAPAVEAAKLVRGSDASGKEACTAAMHAVTWAPASHDFHPARLIVCAPDELLL